MRIIGAALAPFAYKDILRSQGKELKERLENSDGKKITARNMRAFPVAFLSLYIIT